MTPIESPSEKLAGLIRSLVTKYGQFSLRPRLHRISFGEATVSTDITTSMYVRSRITVADAMDAICRMSAIAHPTEYTQFDVDRLTKAAIRLQVNLDDYKKEFVDGKHSEARSITTGNSGA